MRWQLQFSQSRWCTLEKISFLFWVCKWTFRLEQQLSHPVEAILSQQISQIIIFLFSRVHQRSSSVFLLSFVAQPFFFLTVFLRVSCYGIGILSELYHCAPFHQTSHCFSGQRYVPRHLSSVALRLGDKCSHFKHFCCVFEVRLPTNVEQGLGSLDWQLKNIVDLNHSCLPQTSNFTFDKLSTTTVNQF